MRSIARVPSTLGAFNAPSFRSDPLDATLIALLDQIPLSRDSGRPCMGFAADPFEHHRALIGNLPALVLTIPIRPRSRSISCFSTPP